MMIFLAHDDVVFTSTTTLRRQDDHLMLVASKLGHKYRAVGATEHGKRLELSRADQEWLESMSDPSFCRLLSSSNSRDSLSVKLLKDNQWSL
jgi:hypothetical protein